MTPCRGCSPGGGCPSWHAALMRSTTTTGVAPGASSGPPSRTARSVSPPWRRRCSRGAWGNSSRVLGAALLPRDRCHRAGPPVGLGLPSVGEGAEEQERRTRPCRPPDRRASRGRTHCDHRRALGGVAGRGHARGGSPLPVRYPGRSSTHRDPRSARKTARCARCAAVLEAAGRASRGEDRGRPSLA